jgi:hypothetical protein
LGITDYAVTVSAPDDLNDADMATCVGLVVGGGAVTKRYAEPGMREARLLAVVRKADQIVGVGAIKRVRPDYARRRAQCSGCKLAVKTPELGYVARHPEHGRHHLGQRIVASLLSSHEGPLWATTDSTRMKEILAGAGFVRRGKEWPGRRGQLSLWVKGMA